MSAFSGLLTLSLEGAAAAVLIGAVLALAARCRVEVPPFLRHALWLVVFVRLLVPALPASPLGLPPVTDSLGRAGGALLPGLDLARLAAAAAPGGAVPAEADAPSILGAGADGPWAVAAIAWVLGLLAVGARWGVREARLRRRLRDAVPVNDRRTLAAFEEACRFAGVAPDVVPVLESRRIASPAIYGALSPRILLPARAAETLGGAALSHALLHELVHVRRRDGATRLLARLAAAVHWFNPAAWYALRRLEAECELACDAAVLARLGERERVSYGRTLLHAATLATPGPAGFPGARDPLEHAVTALPLSTHQTLKRRIQMIARYRSPSRLRLAAFCLASTALAVVLLTDAPLGAEPAPAPQAEEAGAPEMADAKRTLEAIRNGGTAMFSWITDALLESGAVTREQVMAGDFGRDDDREAEMANPETLAWSDCPAVGYDEARALLVPTYVEELPRTDGWGHELEFCLDRTPADSERWIAGIRSPGRDGAFEGDTYPVGPFGASDLDRDVVWVDGFFITWPSAEADG